MTADLQELFDLAGRNPPASALDPGLVVRRAVRRSRARRITAAVAAAVMVAVGVGVVSHRQESAPLQPATPPHASLGRLAFGLDGGIYLADWDGENPVRIAGGVANGVPQCGEYRGEGPMWSPDGRYLAFRGEVPAAAGPCQGTVIIADAAGRRVASFPGEGWKVAWSPDSSRVATWLDEGRTIGVYGLDGTRQAVLTLPPGLMAPGDFDPAWSPDGRSLLVPHGVLVPLNGSTPRLLPMDDPRTQWHPAFSLDGAHVAYVGQDGALVVTAADGSHARTLVPFGVENFVWSRAGDRIAFETPTGAGTTDMGPASELHVVDVASGRLTLLDGTGGPDTLSVIGFSPEGDRILFSATDAQNVSTLWTVRADGTGAHALAPVTDWGDWQAVAAPR